MRAYVGTYKNISTKCNGYQTTVPAKGTVVEAIERNELQVKRGSLFLEPFELHRHHRALRASFPRPPVLVKIGVRVVVTRRPQPG